MTNNVRIILCGIVAERQRLADLPRRRSGVGYQTQAREAYKAHRAGEHIVPVDFAGWLRRTPTPSDRASLSRTLRVMEVNALVEKVAEPGCRGGSWVALTPAGAQLAAAIMQAKQW